MEILGPIRLTQAPSTRIQQIRWRIRNFFKSLSRVDIFESATVWTRNPNFFFPDDVTRSSPVLFLYGTCFVTSVSFRSLEYWIESGIGFGYVWMGIFSNPERKSFGSKISGYVWTGPDPNPLGIKRFVLSISVSFKCEYHIIMQIQYTKNLNLERFELVTTLSSPNWSIDL